MYKMNTFTLFTAQRWKKKGVEVLEFGGKVWINQRNITDRTQYY